jgi:hypothetical protein
MEETSNYLKVELNVASSDMAQLVFKDAARGIRTAVPISFD